MLCKQYRKPSLPLIFFSVSCPFGYSGFNCAESEYPSHWWEKHTNVAFHHIKGFLFNLCTLMPVALSSPFLDFTVVRLEAGVGDRGLCAGVTIALHTHCSGRGGRQVSFSSAHAWLYCWNLHAPHLYRARDTACCSCTSDHFRSKKLSKASSTADFGKSYSSHSPAPLPGLAGMPRIPRATANKGRNIESDLEMTPSSSRQNLISSGRNSVSMPPCTEWSSTLRNLEFLK